MTMPGRNYTATTIPGYRFGFNGKENSPEISNGAVSFEARIYDARIGRFFSTDPRESEYAWQSTYVYFKNCPTSVLDLMGMGGGGPGDETKTIVGGQKVNFPTLGELQVGKFELYNFNESTYTCNGKTVIGANTGELRAFVATVTKCVPEYSIHTSKEYNIGKFQSTWSVNDKGNLEWAGYLNEKGQTLQAAHEEVNRKWSNGDGEQFLKECLADDQEYLNQGSSVLDMFDMKKDPIGFISLAILPLQLQNSTFRGGSLGSPLNTKTQGVGFLETDLNYCVGSQLPSLLVRSFYKTTAASLNTNVAITETNAMIICYQRNQLRVMARNMMSDRVAALSLEITDPIRPFEFYKSKYSIQGFTGKALWERIIIGAGTTNKSVNANFGIK